MALQSDLLDLDAPQFRRNEDDENMCTQFRGFVEMGFSSATPDKDVALFYAGRCESTCEHKAMQDHVYCEDHRSTLLEIQTGQVDKGMLILLAYLFTATHQYTQRNHKD
jgi:hypothetical protein